MTLVSACGGGGSTSSYTIGGNVSNLTVQGLVLSDGTDTIAVPANATSIVFPTRLSSGASYNVSIATQPPGFTDFCILSKTSGTIGTSNISNITVSCHTASALVTTLAGNFSTGSTNGIGTAANFYLPTGVAADAAGNVYVADSINNLIRKINSAGVVTTLAGSGSVGSADGTGTAASFYLPHSVAVDTSGNVYVADSLNHAIRKITSAGVVTTLAGTGSSGSTDGIGTSASFNIPYGVAVDASGNVYVADTGNSLIRKITPAGIVITIAGNGYIGNDNGIGTGASFYLPNGLAVDTLGNVYVADNNNNVIRKITAAGVVTTFAGSGLRGSADGTRSAASFYNPAGVTVDSAGNVFVADTYNSTIRKITSAGVVTTLAGNTATFGEKGGIGPTASFNTPTGVTADNAGNLYVADNHLISKISPL